jgi:RNA polymerase sigma-32 factor
MASRRKKSADPVNKASESLPTLYKGGQKTDASPVPAPLGSPLQLYLKEISKFPLLTAEQERAAALRAFEEKDRGAFQLLIQSNLRFVVKIAFEYARYGAKVLDLIQEGNMGLIKAVQEFNPYKNVKLTTYAVWWIRSYMQDYLLKNWSIVRVGTTAAQKKLFYRLKKEQERLEREGISPTPAMIAMNLNVPEEDVKVMQGRLSGKDKSLSDPLSRTPDDKSVSYEERVADESPLASFSMEDEEQKSLFQKALNEFQDELDEREKEIFFKRLLSENPMTLSEIGETYGFTKERARQLEERVKKKLRDFLQKFYPDISVDD